ncbi:NAD(P)H-dependent oxidoreductase [Geomicrobium sp. JCM 19039]|uniref:NAD(P)H-dependent oxidoreductase n=1 Tax=Geomicrobium sp. JCM 19039 TaxID=1460636 RepID=UPI00045F405B|nr:NAD(P)H-dependent oxidoreductase [Geomicrobium sp. JCM 19039]GAK11795.1 NAD(P)H oxidoreductase YrkL [Geomicrobium sp. JCM 19039]
MHLIIYMHPTTDSFNGQVLHTYREQWRQRDEDVVIRNLYAQSFDPVLGLEEYTNSLSSSYPAEVTKEHALWRSATAVTFIYPIWWGSFPAIGKGYLDRVLSYGFAYELDGETPIPKMNEKPLGMIYTTGSPTSSWAKKEKACAEGIVKASIADFCGFKMVEPLHLGYVVQADRDEHEAMLKSVRRYVEKFHE